MRSRVGIPQGAVLSPALANLYLHALDKWCVRAFATYLRYGDDLTIGLRDPRERAAAEQRLGRFVKQLRLELRASKTRVEPIGSAIVLDESLPLDIGHAQARRLRSHARRSIVRRARH